MAVKITTTFNNITYPQYPYLVEGYSTGKFTLNIESDTKLVKIHYVCGQYYDEAGAISGTLEDNKYKYTCIIQLDGRITTSDYMYVELYNEDNLVIHYDKIVLPTYGYFAPEFTAYSVGVQYSQLLEDFGTATIAYDLLGWGGYFTETITNRVEVSYEYRSASSSYWKSGGFLTSIGPGDSHYESGTIDIPNLTLSEVTYVRFTITDNIIAPKQVTITVAGKPLFDWSDSDFQFNVPVKANERIILDSEKAIAGTKKISSLNTEEVEILSLKSDNNLYLGFGSYGNEDGNTTYICGDNVDFLANKINLGGVNILGLAKAFSETYTLSNSISTTDPGGAVGPFLSPSCTTKLFGNNLYIRFRCASTYGSLTTGSGDINDVFLGTVTINHGGKIADVESTHASVSTSGTTAGIEIRDMVINGNKLEFSVYMTNTAGQTSVVFTTFNIPVTLDLDAFN